MHLLGRADENAQWGKVSCLFILPVGQINGTEIQAQLEIQIQIEINGTEIQRDNIFFHVC